jgi:hypothetical protein
MPLGAGIAAVILVAFFSVVMALLLWFSQVYGVRQLGCALTAENLKVAQERTIIINCGYEVAVARSLAAVQLLRKVRRIEEPAEGVIDARTRASWPSSGQHIRLRLRRKSDDWTMITISSRPKWIPMLVDHGKNLRNVQALVRTLAKAPEQNGPAARAFA